MKEKLYVVKIINADDASDHFWFKKKGGSLVIVREHKRSGMYITHNPINKEESYGLIPKKHAMVVTNFEYDESKEVE